MTKLTKKQESLLNELLEDFKVDPEAIMGRDGLMNELRKRAVEAMLDGVFVGPAGRPFIYEMDEKQHFNKFRETTIRLYPETVRLGFSSAQWIERCLQKRALEGGGFAKPKPPLFPGKNGRHRQRAFRDALTDILPSEYGFAPTLRLADFEIRDWIFSPDATDRMTALVADRLSL